MLSKNTNSKPKYIRKIIKRSFLNGQVKLTEIWKAVHQHDCPITVSKQSEIISNRTLRSMKGNNLVEKGMSEQAISTFINDGVRLFSKINSFFHIPDTK